MVGTTHGWVLSDVWQTDRLRLLVRTGWRPDADTYETASTVEVVVDLAGVDEDDFEVQLFDNGLVVEGRRLPWATTQLSSLPSLFSRDERG